MWWTHFIFIFILFVIQSMVAAMRNGCGSGWLTRSSFDRDRIPIPCLVTLATLYHLWDYNAFLESSGATGHGYNGVMSSSTLHNELIYQALNSRFLNHTVSM